MKLFKDGGLLWVFWVETEDILPIASKVFRTGLIEDCDGEGTKLFVHTDSREAGVGEAIDIFRRRIFKEKLGEGDVAVTIGNTVVGQGGDGETDAKGGVGDSEVF